MSKEQTNIFSMFGIVDEAEEQKRKEEEKRQKRIEEMKKQESENASSSSNPAASTKKKEEKKEEFNIDENTVAYHLGEYISLTEYFSLEEIRNGIQRKKKEEVVTEKISGNEVRKRMEKDFPDLVAAYTEMVYIKKKNMVLAVAKAKKKGLCESSTSEDSLPSIKKIPFELLTKFVALSHKIYDEKKCECHADIYMDLDKQDFFMDVPEQVATRTLVQVTEDALSIAERLCDIRFVKVMEIHSHHIMSPTPSQQDNESERQENIIYVIVGDIYNVFPTLTARYFFNGRHYSLNPNQLFAKPISCLEFDFDSLVQEGEIL